MTRKLFSLLAVTAVCSLAAPAIAGPMVTHLTPYLTVGPTHYDGKCPGVITFHARVHVTGTFPGGAPVEIGYQWTRSDGGNGPNKFFNATHSGDYNLTETWTLGGGALQHFDGWEKYQVWVTDSGQGGGKPHVWSDEAHFTLKCK
jgi:hypothetical protein